MVARRFDKTFNREMATLPGEGAKETRTGKLRNRLDRLGWELLAKYRPGEHLPSGPVLAERFGVGPITIRRLLSQLRAEGWLTHDPAGSFRVSQVHRRPVWTTGLLFPFDPDILLTSPFYREVGLGISQIAGEARRHLLHFSCTGHTLAEVKPALFWAPQMRAVDSLLTLDIFDIELLTRAGQTYPVACLDADYRIPGVSTVEFDNHSAVRMAFKYLSELGHRRIGYVGRTTSTDPSITLRWETYRQSFQWLGLPMDPEWVFEVHSVENVQRTANHWLHLLAERRPTALIVIDRFWQVAPVWLQAGIRIPQQVSLINIGVLELWSDYLQFAWRSFADDYRTVTADGLHPPFSNEPAALALMQPTTVLVPARAMGRWGMAEVVRRLADPAAEPDHHVLPSDLIIGNTTGPVASG